jgi:hypothetical protein
VVVVLTAFEDSPFGAASSAWSPSPDSDAWLHLRVAREGYAAGSAPAGAVFPAVGMLIRVTGWLLPVTPLTAGIGISIAAFAGALFYLHGLARPQLERHEVLTSIALLAAFPWAVSHSLVGPDGLYLLAAAGSFYHLSRGERIAAAAWGAVLGATRPAGFFMAVPLGLAAWRPGLLTTWSPRMQEPGAPGSRDNLKALITAAAPLAGLAAALLWAGGWTRLFGATPSGRLFAQGGILDAAGPLAHLATRGLLPTSAATPLAALDAMSAAFAVVLIWPVTRRFGVSYGLFIATSLAASLLFAGEASAGRQAAVLFPLFLWMGAVVPLAHRFAWLSLFAMLQALVAVLYFTTGGHL